MIGLGLIVDEWFGRRKCCCGHILDDHSHYSGSSTCNLCPCERFQWRMTKWIY
jgi:hypothetical protein